MHSQSPEYTFSQKPVHAHSQVPPHTQPYRHSQVLYSLPKGSWHIVFRLEAIVVDNMILGVVKVKLVQSVHLRLAQVPCKPSLCVRRSWPDLLNGKNIRPCLSILSSLSSSSISIIISSNVMSVTKIILPPFLLFFESNDLCILVMICLLRIFLCRAI